MKNEMGRACSMYRERGEMHTEFWRENPREETI
jgi:hypothetical protein